MKILAALKKKLKQFDDASEKRRAQARKNSLFKREHYPTYISQKTKWRVDVARKSVFIGQKTKDQLLPKIKKLSLKLAHLNLQEERILTLRFWVYRLSILFFMLLVEPLALGMLHLNVWRYVDVYQRLFASIFVICFLLILDKRWSMVEQKMIFRNRLALLMFVLLVSLGCVYYLSVQFNEYASVVFVDYFLTLVLFSMTGYFTINFISVVTDSLIRIYFDFFGYRNLPEAVVTHNVLMMLDHYEKFPDSMADVGIKVRASDRLEYIAEAIEKDLPNKMRMRNANINRWIKRTTQKIAASIREKQKWIVTPKEDTAKCLTEFLVEFLLYFLRGDWDQLEQKEIPESTAGDWWAKRILPVLRPVLLLGLPIIAYLWLQNSRFSGESWMGTVTGYLIMWLVINFVTLLDPSAKEKIGALADTAGMF